MKKNTKQQCEFLRHQAKQNFDKVRSTWCELLRWGSPHRGTWLLSQTPGERKNQHIVDGTHLLALRSFVAGFLEGNTSASRPWLRVNTKDRDLNQSDDAKAWLQHFTQRVLSVMGSSNFYDAAGTFYSDYGVVNTGCHYFEEREDGPFVHTLVPGSYFPINDGYGVAAVLIREFTLNVMSVVDTYGERDENGNMKWGNISHSVKKMYDDGNYNEKVDIVHVIKKNPDFDPANPDIPDNREWLELTYELGGGTGHYFSAGQEYGTSDIATKNDNVFLRRYTGRRKPFVVGKSTDEFEYGEKGSTLDALGLIKSLNKKAIGKDQALEQILKPALQGPSSLRKSYISHAPNTFVPLDARSAGRGKLEPIFQVNPAVGAITADVEDLRSQVDKFYFADFLLYLSKNPKTRTATETDAILEEQQRIVGPNLQSLNTTYNVPVVEYYMDYVLEEDPYLKPMPEELAGQSLKPEFVSVFAQAQKAADLPAINRYAAMLGDVAQLKPEVLDKFNVDKYADLIEDRLYLPEGLNNSQAEVDEKRARRQQEAQRQQAMTETAPAMAKAAKDMSSAQQQQQQ